MRPEDLKQKLMRMQKETEAGKLNWRLEIQTTEGNEEKYMAEEEGRTWIVDECYVSYNCVFEGRDFCMITYEMMKSREGQMRTSNYIFLPPAGIRFFSLHTLLEYSIEANAVLIAQVRSLWELLAGIWKADGSQVSVRVTQANVNIEDD